MRSTQLRKTAELGRANRIIGAVLRPPTTAVLASAVPIRLSLYNWNQLIEWHYGMAVTTQGG